MGRVSGKIALVTGASSGLGEASARVLAREGAVVVLADIHEAEGRKVLDDIKAQGGDGVFLTLDVAKEDQWIAAMAEIKKRFGRLNVTVNCAGRNVVRSFPSDTTMEDWRALMSVNLDGVFLGTKHSITAMRDSTPVNGSIVNIASVMALVGMRGIAAYNASKGGVRLYTKSVALSLGEERLNIRINNIMPGFIETPLLLRGMNETYKDAAAGRKIYDELQPVGHLGVPDDIAYGVLYLASDESKFVTGSDLVIDGGYTAR
jgi:3(or 17)beta-hydroxysteroid dehydrogenase